MISSFSNPRIKQVVQWQTKAKERRKDSVFVVEGRKMYEEAPIDWVKEVYVSSTFLAKIEKTSSLQEKLARTGFEEVADEVFLKMSDTQTPQGILAIIKQPQYNLQEILQKTAGKQPLFLVLENLQDPGNLGTIMRTGEGAGITGVIMSKDTVDIFNPKVIRSTMGSVYRVPFLYEENLLDTLEVLKKSGIKSYAAHLKGETYYDEFSFKEPTAFLIGNEGNGLSDALSVRADSYLKIPMEGQLESLNAAVASALLMYEAHRQRNTK